MPPLVKIRKVPLTSLPTSTSIKPVYVARSNPLYKEQEADYYEVLSLSSGYYSTYRREPPHSAGNQDQHSPLTMFTFHFPHKVLSSMYSVGWWGRVFL